MSEKFVFAFEDADGLDIELLGNKGAQLTNMTKMGLPVPPGFTITTEACKEYFRDKGKLYGTLNEQIKTELKKVEEKTGKKLGDSENPLLVSVRSGAALSMPGMMDTVLNLGLNDETVKGLVRKTGNERFAYDSYRRFVQMFGNVVLGVKHHKFESILEKSKETQGVKLDVEMSVETLRNLVKDYKEMIKKETGKDFPDNPEEQLICAINAVFDSWNIPRAVTYRKANKLPDNMGTGVNVQTMVFGNMGENSATGVGFSRNPSTGEKKPYGEYLINAQGEDVVAGIRTPHSIEKLKDEMPESHKELMDIFEKLEKHFRDVQDMEFTIEDGKLYMLQTRSGKRTAQAAVKIAVNMVSEGLITKEEALLRVNPNQLETLLHRQIDPGFKGDYIAKGLPASPGAVSGKVVFTADDAQEWVEDKGEKVILVRPETTPDDIHGMIAAEGILTSRGGMTCHAAIVARGMGKPCIAGCEAVKIDLKKKEFTAGDAVVREGEVISLGATSGRVFTGKAPMIEPEMTEDSLTLLKWADEIKRLVVRANADTPEDTRKAREHGAEGIGLCRTEHMFLSSKRLKIVRKMILADTHEAREKALSELLPMQKEDFRQIFREMKGLPVTVRLLDPPLHEFLPNAEKIMEEMNSKLLNGANGNDIQKDEKLLTKVRALAESNPMLGFRGCRLGIVYPEIYEMQAKAIFAAVSELKKENIEVIPEIEIPLVGDANELRELKKRIDRIAKEIMEKDSVSFEYKVGTMIEIPRACLTADEIAKDAQFFSFGTNDLTQTTFAFSRDDAEAKFLHIYLDKNVLKDDPFETIDKVGVGKLMKIAIELGRKTKKDLEIGICGEHGGEPKSVEFCHQIGLDYVSCSPFRVPIARLAAAQAVLKEKK